MNNTLYNTTTQVKTAITNKFAGAMVEHNKLSDGIKKFFTANSKFSMDKSIQKNFRFEVFFDDKFTKELSNDAILLNPYHVLSVNAPTSYGFKNEVMKIGPYSYSFPVMDHNGFDVDIVYEEDELSSIARMIHLLQAKIIRDVDTGANGNYNPQNMNRINLITINIYDDRGYVVRTLEYFNMFFVGATSTALNYEGNESLKYTVSFHGDFFQQQFLY